MAHIEVESLNDDIHALHLSDQFEAPPIHQPNRSLLQLNNSTSQRINHINTWHLIMILIDYLIN